MNEAKRDNNGVTTMIGVLNTDGVTPKNIVIDPATRYLQVDNDTGGSDVGPENAKRDKNNITTLIAVSSADGVTPVPLYVDVSGNLLICST